MSPQQKLESAERDARLWEAKAMQPDLSPQAVTWCKEVARMAQAEVVMRRRELAFNSAQAAGRPVPQALLSVAAPMRAGPGFIYILKSSVTIDGKPVIKIRMTRRTVDQRVGELKTGSVGGFEIADSLHVENARQLERQLHTRFAASRVFAGGGQEFFHVPAESVIAEIERIATEISRERACGAWAAEMVAFRSESGATRLEKRIETALVILGIACWLLLIFGAHSIGEASATVAFFLGPIPLIYWGSRLKQDYMDHYFGPRFGAAIRANHEELRAKYPLAGIASAPS